MTKSSKLDYNWSKRRNIKRLRERKKKKKERNMQALRKSEVKFVSIIGVVHLLTSFWIHLWFLSALGPGLGHPTLATLPVSPSPAWRLSCDQEVRGSVSPLGGTVQPSWEIVGAFPVPLRCLVLVCPSLFPIMYSFWLNAVCFPEQGTISERVPALSCLV